MLPNTSLMAAPSILMRVGSFSAIAASTDTPSRASIRCSAIAAGASITSSEASSVVSGALAGSIVRLLETFELDPVSRVVEHDDVVLLDVGGPRSVDKGREPPLHAYGEVVLVGDELR